MDKKLALYYHIPNKLMEQLEEDNESFFDQVYDAMDEYSMNENISFIEWITMNYYFSTGSVGGSWRHNTTGITQTPYELHKLFLKNRIER